MAFGAASCFNTPITPESLAAEPLQPEKAFWQDTGRGHLALLPYEDARTADDPEAAILVFLQSAYDAGVRAAGWDRTLYDYPHAP